MTSFNFFVFIQLLALIIVVSCRSIEMDSLVYGGDESPIAWLADEFLQQYLIHNNGISSSSSSSNSKIPNRIIGGVDAEPGEVPFITQLFRRFLFSNRFLCGGSLITSRTVLTAAHCVN